MADEQLRSVNVAPRHEWCFDPKGLPTKCYYAGNINGGVILVSDGRVGLRGSAEEAGWTLMHKRVPADEFAKWCEFNAKGDACAWNGHPLPSVEMFPTIMGIKAGAPVTPAEPTRAEIANKRAAVDEELADLARSGKKKGAATATG